MNKDNAELVTEIGRGIKYSENSVDCESKIESVFSIRNIVEFLNGINILNLTILVICVFLWISAPFVAITLFSLGNQPTALQLLTRDNLIVVGKLTETMAFWSSVATLIGIVGCTIGTARKSDKLSRGCGLISLTSMILTFLDVLVWVGGDIKCVFDALGYGYWIMCVLFLTIIFRSKNE